MTRARSERRQARASVSPSQASEDSDLFDLVEAPRRRVPTEGVAIGQIAGFSPDGVAMVGFPHGPDPEPRAALSVVSLAPDDVGRAVAVAFEGGDASRPIVLGLIQSGCEPATASEPAGAPLDARVDGKRVVFEAEREIVLRCGRSSITLSRDGKIRIRGTDLLTRSSGGNRIKGGSVQIN